MSAKETLLGWNKRHGPAAKEFIQNLAKQEEPKLRGILRPHWEREVGESGDQKQRDDFDNVLEYLLLLELGLETQTIQLPDIEIRTLPELKTLLESAAVARYLDSYLYFGVRLFAGRILPAAEGVPERESNTRPLSLPAPPEVERADAVLENFLELKDSDRKNTGTRDALRFLDGYVECEDEAQNYELWLRGLRFESEPGKSRFRPLTESLIQWILQRYEFYKTWVEDGGLASRTNEKGECIQVQFGDRFATDPLAPRFGLVDFYWLAKLLGAEVSSDGIVTYKSRCLIHLLRGAAAPHRSGASGGQLESAEKVLRAVFDFACDLIRNAVDIRNERERRSLPDYRERAEDALGWRQSYDAELEEIDKQRKERSEPQASHLGGGAGTKMKDYWSQRIKTGFGLKNLAGLAFSGGGIRSATFNLGVLQGLKEVDLLRRIDYLSTVSGGGYIGAWLLGNVKRTPHWLSRRENWGESIAHLRRYSNYLAPQVGLLSADAWAMWGIWGRNAFLIQLMTIAWLASVLVLSLLMQNVFDWASTLGVIGRIILGYGVLGISALAAMNVLPLQEKRGFPVIACIVIPAWTGAFLAAALLWNQATAPLGVFAGLSDYSEVLATAYREWPVFFAVLAVSLLVLTLSSIDRGWWTSFGEAVCALQREGKKVGTVIAVLVVPLCPAICAGVLYLEVCGVVWVFRQWADSHPGAGPRLAFVFGPPLMIIAVSVAIAVFLGMIGILSQDWRREWWTRVGAYLGIFGILAFVAAVTSVLGPHAILEGVVKLHRSWSIGAAAGWVGMVISGLLSGNSSKTDGGRKKSSAALDWVAKIAGVLFIAGAISTVATILHLVLVEVWLKADAGSYWLNLDQITGADLSITLAILVVAGAIFSWRFDINIFSLNHFYRNRLVRCYLGATRWLPGLRQPHKFTGFDERDDLPLSSLRHGASGKEARPFRGPFPIVNCTLNLGGSSDLSLHTRQSASFSMTPLRCGADREKVGYAPTGGETSLLTLGHAISVSGAAASPNSGYHTSPLVALLLTMFNVRLAWWFPNPGFQLPSWLEKQDSPTFGLSPLICELFGLAGEDSRFVNLSDGGHFENLGIYELVRRRCKLIIASDGECDPNLELGSLGNVIRMCETDFGAKIDLDVASVRKQAETGMSRAHCAVGRISYSNGSLGYLIYLKASITGEEDVGIEQYRAEHPHFPHETTADQFFSEDQFEAYRRLGCHIAQQAFRSIAPGSDPLETAEKLYDLWTPAGSSTDSFVRHAKSLDELWERFRNSPLLQALLKELLADTLTPPPPAPSNEETCACLELVQLMENVFLDLRLDDFWEHPDHRGWALLFTQWAKSGRFRAAWPLIKNSFGIRFEHFCADRLGLPKSASVARA
jgi:hypothetical protein